MNRFTWGSLAELAFSPMSRSADTRSSASARRWVNAWNHGFTGYLGEVAMRDKDGKEIRSRSRTNSPDPETLTPVTNDRGQSKLGILFGGRLGGTRFIEYIRDKIGLSAELRAADLELGKDEDENENTLGPDARASTTPQADTAGTLV